MFLYIEVYCDAVEATPVESLPGHIDSTKSNIEEKSLSYKKKGKEIKNLNQTESKDYRARPFVSESSGGEVHSR